MSFQRLKSFMPRSLYGRAALIVLVPIVTIILVVSIVFVQRLYENVTRQMTEAVAQEMRLIVSVFENGAQSLEEARAVAEPLGIAISEMGAPDADRRGWEDFSGRVIIETIRAELPEIEAVDLVSADGFVTLALAVDMGVLRAEISRRRFSARNPHQFLVVIGFTAILMTAIALVYMRGQMRPIRRLAAAATAFGKGRVIAYTPSGATEVREAGSSFLEMRERIERQIEQRTLMLSGVSHDLRTPLTRMRLALDLMEDDADVKALRADVDDMQRMIDAFLEFGRAEQLDALEDVEPLDLVAAAAKRARRAGANVELATEAQIGQIPLRPASLARALDNLVGNAVRYGNIAVLSVFEDEENVVFRVEDDGPGIPEPSRERALSPFVRLDDARNQDKGSGVGLGLSIAADIARQHGGVVRLGDSGAHGGLCADIVLPV